MIAGIRIFGQVLMCWPGCSSRCAARRPVQPARSDRPIYAGCPTVTSGPLSPKAAGVFIGIKADEQPIARSDGRSTQVAGWADQVLFELGVGGRIASHVEVENLFSFG